MMKILKAYFNWKTCQRHASKVVLGLIAALSVWSAIASVGIDTVPLSVPNSVPGNMVLVPSVEWPTVVTHANDPALGDGSSGYAGYSATLTTTCPSGYTLSGGSCVQTQPSTVGCASGFTLSSDSSSCKMVVSVNVGCASGFTLADDSGSCSKTVPVTVNCPSGGYIPTSDGSSCTLAVPVTVNCPSGGYTPSSDGSTCTMTVPVTVNCSPISYTPNSGGTACTATPTPSTPYACPSDGTYTSSPSGTKTAATDCTKSTTGGTCYAGPPPYTKNASNRCTGKAIPTYTCPTGGTVSGQGTNSICTATAAPTYSCTASTKTGGTGASTICTASVAPTSYTCASPSIKTGGTGASTICTATSAPTSYTCPSPSTKTGGAGTSTICTTMGSLVYSCPSGSSATGGAGASTVCTATGTLVYSCPAGATSSPSGAITASTICTISTSSPTTTTPAYAGYFNSGLCYAYNYDPIEANRYFYPVSTATAATSSNAYSCAGQTGGTPNQHLWSGNFMNWAATQAIDTFRLALTGGYRVNRPADGAPPNVTVIDSLGNSTSYATSEQPGVTYLEKANSDRWDDSYTKTRSLASGNSLVDDATPVSTSSNSGFRIRIGALRSQMWFAPNAAQSMGSNRGYSSPCALALPVVDGIQPEPGGATINSSGVVTSSTSSTCSTTVGATSYTAIPYNPAYDTLPNVTTANNTNSTPCGTSPIEYGCTTATWTCPNGGTANASGTCSAQTAVTACTGSTNGFYRSSDAQCHTTNVDGTTNRTTTNLALLCLVPGATITNANSSTKNQTTCGVLAYAGTPATYAHPGNDLVYAVSVRVKVCDPTLDTRDMCTKYGSYYKPEGLLQKNAKKTRYSVFSYLTETGQVRQGGVMRARQKLISPVSAEETAGTEKPYPDRTGRISGIDNPEWDSVTGVFLNNPDSTDASDTSGRIGTGCTSPDGSGCAIRYSGVINYLNRFGQINTGQPTLKGYDNLSEMYYTAVRYLRGLANIAIFSALDKLSGSDLNGAGALAKYQNSDGFPVIENWFKTGVNAAARLWTTSPAISVGQDGDPMLYQCQTTVMLGIGDTHTNNEDDQYSCDSVQGGTSSNCPWRSYLDPGTSSDVHLDVAGLAYWAHLNDIRADVPNTAVEGGATGAKRGQTIGTYWVDVVEQSQLYTAATSGSVNQYYNATKYGGYNIPLLDWDVNGNAMQGGTTPPHNAAWFTSNYSAWTSATQNVNQTTGFTSGFSGGDYRKPNNMFFGNNGQAMIAGLTAAFSKIALELSGSGASLAANSTQLNNGTTTYQAIYKSGTWSGDLRAFAVNANGTIGTAALWNAVDAMPTAANRVIKTTSNGLASGVVDFKTTTLPTSLRNLLGPSGDTSAQDNMINYLRGVNIANFRSRTTPLGDIVDSQPVFVGPSDPNVFYGKTFTGSGTTYTTFAAGTTTRSKRVWVNANDGMLHSFNADCTLNASTPPTACTNTGAGAETFAYLPKAVLSATGVASIKNLADPQYGTSVSVPHQYFNDGEITVADVYSATPSDSTVKWRTVLVGTTGRGPAKAIYALDVTDPTAPTLLWEKSTTDSTYIGQMTGKPIVAQTADGVWSVLMGNGYNSASTFAALLQFKISDGTFVVHTTDENGTTGVDNGLGTPAVWIADPTNGISTEAYAGDLHGNVWHFDLSGSAAGTVVFVAMDSSSKRQPISAGMLIGKDPLTSKVWLFFGTGRYLSQSDLRDTSVQTWYGIVVEGTNAVSSSTSRSSLAARTIAGEQVATATTVAARAINTPTAGDIGSKSGWYMDLMVGTTQKGERMVTTNQFQGSLLLGTTRIPVSTDPCNPSGSGWVMVISPFTGAPPTSSFFDVNSSGTAGTDDTITIGGVTYVAAGIGFDHAPNNPIFVGNAMLLSFDDASKKGYMTAGNVGLLKRLTWRELVAQ